MMNYDEAKEQLRSWVNDSKADNFHALLYILISKSDPENRAALRKGFPNEVKVFEDWHKCPTSDQFFSQCSKAHA
jgi:hypothetical protein